MSTKSPTRSVKTTPAQNPEVIHKHEDHQLTLDETIEEVFDDIFIEYGKSTTAKPANIRKVRIPKLQSSQIQSISSPEEKQFQPVHRNEKVKLVLKIPQCVI